MKLYCSRISHNPYIETDLTEITESIFIVDGHHLIDRLLDGVEFFVEFKDEEILSVKINPEHEVFFNNFNKEMFLESAKNYAEWIVKNGDEVDIPKYLKDKYYLNGKGCVARAAHHRRHPAGIFYC